MEARRPKSGEKDRSKLRLCRGSCVVSTGYKGGEGVYLGTSVKTATIKAEILKRSSGHKKAIGSATFSDTLFRESIRLFLQGNSGWNRQGHALIKAVHKAGLTEVA